jgi:hypothetical protein
VSVLSCRWGGSRLLAWEGAVSVGGQCQYGGLRVVRMIEVFRCALKFQVSLLKTHRLTLVSQLTTDTDNRQLPLDN